MQGDREAAGSRVDDSVVTYYPNGHAGRFTWSVIFILWSLATLVCAIANFTEIRVRCDRAQAACSIDSEVPIIGTRSEKLALASIKGARAQKIRGEDSYRVALVTTSGEDALSTSYSGDSRRIEGANALDAFFKSDKDSSIDVLVDAGNRWLGIGLLVASLFCLFVAWAFGRYAKVVVSWRDRTLTIVRVRWPFHSRGEAFPLASVRDAVVTKPDGKAKKPGDDAKIFGVSLVIGDFEKLVPLLAVTSAGLQTKQQAVSEIQALLRLRDAGGPDCASDESSNRVPE